jgi:putative FmdB family regulatory protein
MPLYNYQCEQHGEFVELKTIDQRNESTVCPSCNQLAHRSITAPNLSIMSATNRKAWARNEKSAHEPRRVTHSHSCNHAHHKHDDHASSHTQYKTASAGTRPWMLGH